MQERNSNAGRKRIDPMIPIRVLILNYFFKLSDEELECQVKENKAGKMSEG